jgi:hypothetical protein
MACAAVLWLVVGSTGSNYGAPGSGSLDVLPFYVNNRTLGSKPRHHYTSGVGGLTLSAVTYFSSVFYPLEAPALLVADEGSPGQVGTWACPLESHLRVSALIRWIWLQVISVLIDRFNGSLTAVSTVQASGSGTVHLSSSPSGHWLLAVNYNSHNLQV